MMRHHLGRKAALALALVLATMGLTAVPAFATVPAITSFSPSSGVLYQYITINGSNFVAPTTVQFGSVSTTSTVVSATKLSVRVPPTAASGPITVTNANGSATSTASFTVNPGIWLNATMVAPTGKPTVRASGLAPNEGVDVYLDSTVVAFVVASSTGSISTQVTIPASTQPGTHSVSVYGLHSSVGAQTTLTVRTNWSQQGGNAGHTNVNTLENAIGTSNVGTLDPSWSFTENSADPITSQPAVTNDVVYVTTSGGYLWAVSEATGALQWYAALPGYVKHAETPVVVGSLVYVGDNAGNIYAYPIGATCGCSASPTWHDSFTGDFSGSMAYANGTLYASDFATGGGDMYALSPSTGAVVWHTTVTPPTTGGYAYTVTTAPAVGAGLVYASFAWTCQTCATGGPGSGTFQDAFDMSSGAERGGWGGYGVDGPDAEVFGAGILFATASIDDNLLQTWDVSQQTLGWSAAQDSCNSASTAGGEITMPAIANGVAYVTTKQDSDYSGRTCALRASDGKLLWANDVGWAASDIAPFVANGIVYTWDQVGRTLHALDVNGGSVLWSYQVPGTTATFQTPVAVDGGVLAVDGGTLYRFTPQGTPATRARHARALS